MKKFLSVILALLMVCAVCGISFSASNASMTRKQYQKNLKYNKNALPSGWQYEAGYTYWRMQKGLPLNKVTYKRYRKDKAWRRKMSTYNKPEEILLNTADWTTEELTRLWESWEDYLKFHPAGDSSY